MTFAVKAVKMIFNIPVHVILIFGQKTKDDFPLILNLAILSYEKVHHWPRECFYSLELCIYSRISEVFLYFKIYLIIDAKTVPLGKWCYTFGHYILTAAQTSISAEVQWHIFDLNTFIRIRDLILILHLVVYFHSLCQRSINKLNNRVYLGSIFKEFKI